MIKVRDEVMVCSICGKKIKRGSNFQKYCKDCSVIKAKQDRDKHYQKKCLLKDMTKKCAVCGNKFTAFSRKQRYCSKECFEFFYDDWKKKYRKEYLKNPNNRLHRYIANAKRRAQKKNIIEEFTETEWINKLKSTNGICSHCKKDVGILKLTLDHIYPVSKANEKYLNTRIQVIYRIDDVQPLCKRCNSSKGNKIK